MSKDTNNLTITGRLTRDCETKTISDRPLVTFSLAVNGYKKDDVSFFDVNLWGKLGAAISKYLLKGKQVIATGEIKQQRWQGKEDGNTRSKVIINANNVQLLGSASNTTQTDGVNNVPRTGTQEPANNAAGNMNFAPDGNPLNNNPADEQIPF